MVRMRMVYIVKYEIYRYYIVCVYVFVVCRCSQLVFVEGVGVGGVALFVKAC